LSAFIAQASWDASAVLFVAITFSLAMRGPWRAERRWTLGAVGLARAERAWGVLLAIAIVGSLADGNLPAGVVCALSFVFSVWLWRDFFRAADTD
jgi:hypothetical protein